MSRGPADLGPQATRHRWAGRDPGPHPGTEPRLAPGFVTYQVSHFASLNLTFLSCKVRLLTAARVMIQDAFVKDTECHGDILAPDSETGNLTILCMISVFQPVSLCGRGGGREGHRGAYKGAGRGSIYEW